MGTRTSNPINWAYIFAVIIASFVPVTIGLLAAISGARGKDGDLFGLGIVFGIGLFFWSTIIVASAIITAISKKRKLALSLIAIFILAWPVMALEVTTRDYIHLIAHYDAYQKKIKSSNTMPVVVEQYKSGFAGMNNSETSFIYDATGAFAQKIGTHDEYDGPEIEISHSYVRHLFGNFYVERIYTYPSPHA